MIEVLTISTSRIQCGIAEYLHHLAESSPGDLIFRCDPAWLDPEVFFAQLPAMQEYQGPQVVWLNYHAALHSRWTPDRIAQLRFVGFPVVITYHDTGVPNGDQCLGMYRSTLNITEGRPKAAFIIHEPCTDLPYAIYLRQGIPAWVHPPALDHSASTPETFRPDYNPYWLGRNNRPVLGSVGFPFPWKNYDLLAATTALAGWSLLLIAPHTYEGGKTAQTDPQIDRWRQLNPWTAVMSDFISAPEVVSWLATCDATAFLYTCANTGTSGAIRQGIAARKPVLATAGCRQFRDLQEDSLGHAAITWLEDLSPTGVADALMQVPIQRLDPRIHALAQRDSWTHQAERYAEIFRQVAR